MITFRKFMPTRYTRAMQVYNMLAEERVQHHYAFDQFFSRAPSLRISGMSGKSRNVLTL